MGTSGVLGACWTAAATVGLALAVSLPGPALAHHDEVVDKLGKGSTEMVSVSSEGEIGDGPSGGRCTGNGYSASDDGRFIAFVSRAGNLHPGDTNGKLMADVFVYDRKKNELDLVSAMPHGLTPPVPKEVLPDTSFCPGEIIDSRVGIGSNRPVISGNGRFVAFQSSLPLTGADEPASALPLYKVFVRDLKEQKTELVSVTSKGLLVIEPIETWLSPSISDNGRFVAFTTQDPLVTDDPCPATALTGCGRQAYVRDRKKDETLLVSISNAGEKATTSGVGPAFLSGNGRYVAFDAVAENLADPFEYGCPPVFGCGGTFVHDLKERKTELVSLTSDEQSVSSRLPSHSDGWKPQVFSDDGRFVMFYSNDQVVPWNAPLWWSYHYVRDRKAGRTERVSVSSTGWPLFVFDTPTHSISDDGRYVLQMMDTRQDSLPWVSPEHHVGVDMWLDRQTGQTDWILGGGLASDGSEAPPGARGSGESSHIGGNGRFVVWVADDGVESEQGRPPRVPDDRNGVLDVFVRDLGMRPLALGALEGPGGGRTKGVPPVCLSERCIPPREAMSILDKKDGATVALAAQGADLYGASLAYRPDLSDLFGVIELEHMPPVLPGLLSPLVHGLRFEAEGTHYEVRVGSLLGGTFSLFECSGLACTKLGDLKGGYGTTGTRLVFSLPLGAIGLDEGGELSAVEAFSGLGTLETGAAKILDTVMLD